MKLIISGKPNEIAKLLNTTNSDLSKTERKQAKNKTACACKCKRGLNNPPIYGVKGLYSPMPELIRTDDAVDMNFSIDYNTGEIASDFNDVFPWNECEIVDDTAGKFLSFPTMYFRVGADDNNRLTDIAVSKQPTNEGKWYKVEPFMYGCYGGSLADNKLKSIPDTSRCANITFDALKGYIKNNGDEYKCLDIYHHTVLTFLWYIEFATKDDQSIMTGRIYGSGRKRGCSMRPTGGTDSLGTPSGFETAYGQMRYHYIEDFVGNVMEYIDGVIGGSEGEHDKVINDAGDVCDEIAYTIPAEGWLSALGWDSEHPFICLPTESNGTDSTYFCTYSDDADSSYPIVCFGAGYNGAGTYHGLSFFYRINAGSTDSYRGGRLLKS